MSTDSTLICLTCLLVFSLVLQAPALDAPQPAQVWAGYDPDHGEFKEEVVESTALGGIINRRTYISAYVLGQEIRVYCQCRLKDGLVKAPGLLDVHGWGGSATVNQGLVDAGWVVMGYDYSGKYPDKKDYTRYPESLRHGNMDDKEGPPVFTHVGADAPITDVKQTSVYLWLAIERRVLSYLEQQKEVDRKRLGASGYSYGGTILWGLGTDPRVKAIVPHFGIGWIEYYRDRSVWLYNDPYVEPPKTRAEELYLAGIAPEAYVSQITAPTLFLSGSNDHHGGFERGLESFKLFKKGVPWAFAVQARGHHNTEKIEQDCALWLEKYVAGKEVFWPAHPKSEITLDQDGVPQLIATPAAPERVKKVEMYYALKNPCSFDRAWRDAECVKKGDTWVCRMPVLSVDDYVFGYANITYDSTVVLSTGFNAAIPAKLGKAKATDTVSEVLYSGSGGLAGWSNVVEIEGPKGIKGFRSTDNNVGSGTEQINDPKWKAPPGKNLAFKVYCTQPVTLILVVNNYYQYEFAVKSADDWQDVVIRADQLIWSLDQKGNAMRDGWEGASLLSVKPKAGSDIGKVVFTQFKWVDK